MKVEKKCNLFKVLSMQISCRSHGLLCVPSLQYLNCPKKSSQKACDFDLLQISLNSYSLSARVSVPIPSTNSPFKSTKSQQRHFKRFLGPLIPWDQTIAMLQSSSQMRHDKEIHKQEQVMCWDSWGHKILTLLPWVFELICLHEFMSSSCPGSGWKRRILGNRHPQRHEKPRRWRGMLSVSMVPEAHS